jgi:hypothetical protein
VFGFEGQVYHKEVKGTGYGVGGEWRQVGGPVEEVVDEGVGVGLGFVAAAVFEVGEA